MRKMNVVLAILFSLGATTVEAQGIGSLKQKVVQAATGQNAATSQAAQQGGSKLGFVLTDAVMVSLAKGMEIEIRMRQDYTGSLAGLKTQDEFYLCQGQTQASPEGMQIQEEMIDRMDKATTDAEMQKVMEWMADSLNVLVTRACGADPQSKLGAQKVEFEKARDAGSAEFLTVFQPGESVPPFSYGILQEWAVPFYQLSAQEQQDAAANGLSIPGTGTNIFWVYTAEEASLLVAHKATLVPLMKELI